MSLLDIAIGVGFNSQSYYSSVFKKITNKTPLEYKQQLKI
jgi:AraC-like DNA-binding protein